MVMLILEDLKIEQDYLFEIYTDSEVIRLIEHYLNMYHKLKWDLPQNVGKGVYNVKFKSIVRRYIKYRKPHEYPKGAQDHRKVSEDVKKAARQRAVKKYQSKPEYKIAHSLRRRTWQILKGKRKDYKMLELLGCSIDELRSHLEGQFDINMTWDNYGEWHIDHIIPLCSVDPEDKEEMGKVSHFTNLRPLWRDDNLKKVATDITYSRKKKAKL